MIAKDFRIEIELKRPRYLTKYMPMMEAISKKGTIKGGDYIQFGQFYQTYMYAFMIGYKLGECNIISGLGEQTDFFPIGGWKPSPLVDYILAMILNESHEKLGFDWIKMDTMTEDELKNAASTIARRIEGYANTGLNYLQDKFDNQKEEFRDPFVFVNIMRNIKKWHIMKSSKTEQNVFQMLWDRFKTPLNKPALYLYFLICIVGLSGSGIVLAIIKDDNISGLPLNLSVYALTLLVPSAIAMINDLLDDQSNARSTILICLGMIFVAILLLTLSFFDYIWAAGINVIMAWFFWIVANYNSKYLDDKSLGKEVKDNVKKLENNWN